MMACPTCTLPLTWLQLRALETHQRQLCRQGDPQYDHRCEGSIFVTGGMGCGYAQDAHEVWICVDPRLTLGSCGPAKHQLKTWEPSRPWDKACFAYHESTLQFEHLGDNYHLDLTGNVHSGKESCEYHFYNRAQCQSIGCCQWNARYGDVQPGDTYDANIAEGCWSAVGDAPCFSDYSKGGGNNGTGNPYA